MEKLPVATILKKLTPSEIADWATVNDLTPEEELQLAETKMPAVMSALLAKPLQDATLTELIREDPRRVLYSYNSPLKGEHILELASSEKTAANIRDVRSIAEIEAKTAKLIVKKLARQRNNALSELYKKARLPQPLRKKVELLLLMRGGREALRELQVFGPNRRQKQIAKTLRKGYGEAFKKLILYSETSKEHLIAAAEVASETNLGEMLRWRMEVPAEVIDIIFKRYPQDKVKLLTALNSNTCKALQERHLLELEHDRLKGEYSYEAIQVLVHYIQNVDVLPQWLFEKALKKIYWEGGERKAYSKAQLGKEKFDQLFEDPYYRQWLAANPLMSREQLLTLSREDPEYVFKQKLPCENPLSEEMDLKIILRWAARSTDGVNDKACIQAKKMLLEAKLKYGSDTFNSLAENWEGTFKDLLVACQELGQEN